MKKAKATHSTNRQGESSSSNESPIASNHLKKACALSCQLSLIKEGVIQHLFLHQINLMSHHSKIVTNILYTREIKNKWDEK